MDMKRDQQKKCFLFLLFIFNEMENMHEFLRSLSLDKPPVGLYI